MADIEHIGLLLEGDTLYGVASKNGVPGEVSSWRIAASAERGMRNTEGEESAEGGAFDAASALVPDDISSDSAAAGSSLSLSAAFAAAGKALDAADGCVLALPPDVLVTKVISLPPVEPDAIGPMVRLQMEKLAPVSGDSLDVAYEVIGATEDSTRVFAVAMPMSKLDELANDLSSAGVLLSRIDSSLLCQWRVLADYEGKPDLPSCYAALFMLPSGRCDLVIADEFGPVFARSFGNVANSEELVRELVLSLLNLGEEHDGLAPEALMVIAAERPDDAFSVSVENAAGIKTVWLDSSRLQPYVNGVVLRDAEEGHIDIVPGAWRDAEMASVRQGRFMTGICTALVVWVLILAGLLLAPKYMENRVAAVDASLKKITPAYRVTSDTRSKVRLIRSYLDRSHSLLDVLRTICVNMPDGIVFSSISYEKGGEVLLGGKNKTIGGIKIIGDADSSSTVFSFKDELDKSGLFTPAKLTGPSMDGKRQRFKFEIDCRFVDEEGAQ